MEVYYSRLNYDNKSSIELDGMGEVINGERKYVHLLTIHDCNDIIIKNFTFTGGDTNLIKRLKRSDIPFRNSQMSIFEIIDGGAVVITGDSTVTFENCKFINNKSIMCGGAVSNQSTGKVRFSNCLFENNIAGHTGSAIDNLTIGSNLEVENCKFINNKSNSWYLAGAPHGQISIFPNTKTRVSNSAFLGGSLPYDYFAEKDVIDINNEYSTLENWKAQLAHRKKATLLDRLELAKRMYWIVPKTLGKVYFRVNN